jgi:plasmid maintenance system antidote protein VapI
MKTCEHARQIQPDRIATAFGKAMDVFMRELGILPEPAVALATPRRHRGTSGAARRGSRMAKRGLGTSESLEDQELLAELEQSVVVTPQTLSDTLQTRLRSALEESELTQRQLAERLGVSPAVVTRILQHPERSKLETLLRVAKAMGTDLARVLA